MNKNIVIFGCDNSGKTTLSSNLKFVFDLKFGQDNVFQIRSLGPGRTLNEQIDFMEKNLSMEGFKIFDRFPILEENVCGPIFRGKSNFENYPVEEQMKLLRYVDLFIFCYPGLFNVIKWGTREQMEGVKENVIDLISGYNKIAFDLKNSGFNIMEYNYTIDSYKGSGVLEIARRLL